MIRRRRAAATGGYYVTAGALAIFQWSWRMALLTGEAKYSDLAERTLFNAVLPGVSLDGARCCMRTRCRCVMSMWTGMATRG